MYHCEGHNHREPCLLASQHRTICVRFPRFPNVSAFLNKTTLIDYLSVSQLRLNPVAKGLLDVKGRRSRWLREMELLTLVWTGEDVFAVIAIGAFHPTFSNLSLVMRNMGAVRIEATTTSSRSIVHLQNTLHKPLV